MSIIHPHDKIFKVSMSNLKVANGGEYKRTVLYGTTLEFLEYFGLNDIHDLPELPKLEEFTGLRELVNGL